MANLEPNCLASQRHSSREKKKELTNLPLIQSADKPDLHPFTWTNVRLLRSEAGRVDLLYLGYIALRVH